MRLDHALGIIVFRRGKGSIKYLILKHGKGHWSFPKGHADDGENKLETAKRELKEETGISDIKLISKKVAVKEKYSFKNRKGEKVLKVVEYFIAETETSKAKVDGKEIIDYKWIRAEEGNTQITYGESRNLLAAADKLVRKYLNR